MKKIMKIIFPLFITLFGITSAYSQSCICPVNSLVINTGYDPNTGLAIASGSVDPRWTVSFLSPACSAVPGAVIPGPTTGAIAISPQSSWTGPTPTSTWISFGNFNCYPTFGPPDGDWGTYVAHFTRSFFLCEETDVTIDMRFAFDNSIDILVDGSTSIWSRVTLASPLSYGMFQPPVPFILTIPLSAGPHTLDFIVDSWEIDHLCNGHGLQVVGTISTPGDELAREGPADPPPTVTLTQPGFPSPNWVYRIDVTGGDCPDYVVDYDLFLNQFPYCGYEGPISKSALISGGSFVDFTYWYLDNDIYAGAPGTSGGFASTLPFSYSASSGYGFGTCDPHAPPAWPYTTVHDWGIYNMCLTSVSGCGCTWPLIGCAGGKGSPNPDESLPKELSKLSLTPNPTTGAFTISGSLPSIKTSKEANIEVTDLLGKTIYTDVAAIENGSISKQVKLGREVANGIYLVRIKNTEVNEVIKFTLDR